jgi:hypothetical protein
MYEKILNALKTKFKGVPGEVLEKRARKLSETVSEEESVQTAVDGVELGDLFKAYGDSRATQATETARQKADREFREKYNLDENGKPKASGSDGKGGGNDNPPAGKSDEMPEWAKSFSQKVEELSTGLSQMQKEKARQERAATVQSKLKAAGIPERLHKRFMVDDEADETAIDAAVTEFKQELNDIGFSGLKEPGSSGEASETSSEEVEGYLNEKFGNNEN